VTWAGSSCITGIFIDPFQANADVSQSITFTARVENAEDPTVEWYTEGPLPGDFTPNGNQATVVTPSDPWSPAIVLKARSMANTGLRENVVNTDPREGVAPINYGNALVVVIPNGQCVKPGETQEFSATVIGIEDQSVTWSTDPPATGFFSGNVFNAPNNNAGTVVIIATSVVNPNAQGFAVVHVGGCECWWTANIWGDRSFTWTGTNAVFGSQLPGYISFMFETKVEGPGIHYPVVTASITAPSDAIGTFQAIGAIQANDADFWSPGDPDSNALPEMTILSNDGVTIEGTLTGPVLACTHIKQERRPRVAALAFFGFSLRVTRRYVLPYYLITFSATIE